MRAAMHARAIRHCTSLFPGAMVICVESWSADAMQWQNLAVFDDGSSGMLTAAQLAAFVASLAGQLPGLSGVERHLPPRLYAAVATRKLLFFHGRRGR